MSAGKIVLGAVIALAAGAVLGMLFAPAKGSATRKKLMKQGSRYADAASETAGEYANALEDAFDGVKENVVGLADGMKDLVTAAGGHTPQKHTHGT
jgi:gas vesicle protein